jgi:putative hydrolase of the HAD superfamily
LIKVIGFDLDETLYDEISFVKSGFRAVSQFMQAEYQIDKDDFFDTLMHSFHVQGRGHNFDFALRKHGFHSPELIDRLIEIYRSHEPEISLREGTREFLMCLSRKYDLGIITDGIGRVQRNKVKSLEIEELFDVIIYTDDYGKENWKPSELPYRKLLGFFDSSPDEVMYVGDNPHRDFVSANKIGMRTVRLHKGKHKDSVVGKDYAANYHITNIHELQSVLKIVNGQR